MTPRRFARLALIPTIFASLAFLTPALLPSDATAADRGTRHALIVGVSEYPSLEGRDLYGPANDAKLVADTLTNWGFDRGDIRIVADGVEGAELPTRDAILGAMDDLIGDVRDGDFVYLHFSGHGSRQPVVSRGDRASEEPDNFDEIFLPRDIGFWDDGIDAVENAIVDDEINYFITSLRNNGAFVWIVFDSCHSGDMTRSIEPDGEIDREIDFMELVRPAEREIAMEAFEEAESSQVRSRGSREAEHSFSGDEAELDDDAAGFVAFFAAQTTETTPEMRLPRGVRPRQAHGMFTFTLMNLVQTNPGLTYRQLGEQLMFEYESMHRTRPTPLFVGTGLDANVFGATAGEQVEQYRIEIDEGEVRLPAGNLHDVTAGTVLAVVAQPGADTSEAIGYLEVTSAQLSESRAVPVEYSGIAPLDLESVPGTAYGRPIQRSVTLRLAVALPEDQAIADSIRELVESDEDGLENMIEWVDPLAQADLRLVGQDGDVWFLPPSGQLCTRELLRAAEDAACRVETDITPSVEFPSRTGGAELLANLRAVARATNLMNVAQATSFGGSPGVRLTMEIRYRNEEHFESPNAVSRAVPEYCTRAFVGDDDVFSPVSPGVRPRLRPGDCVRFRIDNESRYAQDVTVLFIDGSWGIESYFPARSGESNRIESDGFAYLYNSTSGFIINANTSGIERMLMISVPARGGLTTDFSYLAQPRLRTRRALGEGSELQALLDMAGFEGGRTRGLGHQAQDETTTQLLSWITETQ